MPTARAPATLPGAPSMNTVSGAATPAGTATARRCGDRAWAGRPADESTTSSNSSSSGEQRPPEGLELLGVVGEGGRAQSCARTSRQKATISSRDVAAGEVGEDDERSTSGRRRRPTPRRSRRARPTPRSHRSRRCHGWSVSWSYGPKHDVGQLLGSSPWRRCGGHPVERRVDEHPPKSNTTACTVTFHLRSGSLRSPTARTAPRRPSAPPAPRPCDL